MSPQKRRLWITTKEVQIVLECSGRKARRLLERIRRRLKKGHEQPVSFAEFCLYMGVDTEVVYQRLGM